MSDTPYEPGLEPERYELRAAPLYRFDLDRHVRHHELNRLEARDRLAEGLALLRIFDALVKRTLSDAGCDRADFGPAPVERRHRVLETLAFAADQGIKLRTLGRVARHRTPGGY